MDLRFLLILGNQFQVGKKYGPVARVTLPGKDIVVISDPVLARQVLRGHNGTIGKDDLFQQAMTGIARYGLFALPDNDMYTRHRKKLQPAFSPINLQRGLEIANLCAKELLTVFKDKMAKGENGFDMYHGLTSAVADVIGRLAFSYEVSLVLRNLDDLPCDHAEGPNLNLPFSSPRYLGCSAIVWKHSEHGGRLSLFSDASASTDLIVFAIPTQISSHVLDFSFSALVPLTKRTSNSKHS
jgi:cytochrome P450